MHTTSTLLSDVAWLQIIHDKMFHHARETLPPSIMEASVHLIEGCLRSSFIRHGGYESSTEGDSFIIAFASVESALRCCLEAQEVLLNLAWPPELLRAPGCKEVWARASHISRLSLSRLGSLTLPYTVEKSDPGG